jgi:hypothetical protein
MISTSRLRGTEYLPKNIYVNAVIAVKMVADIVRLGSIKKAEGLRINKNIVVLSAILEVFVENK